MLTESGETGFKERVISSVEFGGDKEEVFVLRN